MPELLQDSQLHRGCAQLERRSPALRNGGHYLGFSGMPIMPDYCYDSSANSVGRHDQSHPELDAVSWIYACS